MCVLSRKTFIDKGIIDLRNILLNGRDEIENG